MGCSCSLIMEPVRKEMAWIVDTYQSLKPGEIDATGCVTR